MLDISLVQGVIAAVVVIVSVQIVKWFIKYRRDMALYNKLPQPKGHPIFGSIMSHPGPRDDGLAYQRNRLKEFPRLSLDWLAHVASLNISHPDLVKVVMKHEPKSIAYTFLYPWLGLGLLTSDGNKWARSRRLLTPAFHYDILKDYIQLKNELSDVLLAKFEAAKNENRVFNVFNNISLFTLDVMLQSTMSYKTGCQEMEEHPYIQAVSRINKTLTERFLNPLLQSETVFLFTPACWAFRRDCAYVHKVADEVIAKRKKELESGAASVKVVGTKRRRDFLDTLLTARDEDGKGLSDREIREQVDTFLFEGHDTTASAISWNLYSIAEHQDIQERCQDEIDALLSGRENDYLGWEDMSKLPYLTKVIKEGMRLHSPVPVIVRMNMEETKIDGYRIPAGTFLNISLYDIHHNPAVWEDSMKFDPERFSPENIDKRDPFAYVPFSAGYRNCIGQNFAMDEIKICIARIIHRYNISLDPDTKLSKYHGLVMKADPEIKLVVKPRTTEL